MPRPRLHLDADVSSKRLQQALLDRGHDVTRTPITWAALDDTDERQLLNAAAQGRCILTSNIKDFVRLAAHHPEHSGIILASQNRWTLPELIAALDRLLSTTEAEDLRGQVRWLNEWR
jgi:hypothetical protein